jgi:hypothetical protein
MKMKCSIVIIDPFQGRYVSEAEIGFGAFFDMQSCDLSCDPIQRLMLHQTIVTVFQVGKHFSSIGMVMLH